MKKLIVLVIVLMATCAVAMAQPRAIGGRVGYGIGVSYQHGFGEKNMLQADLDFPCYYRGIQGTATYNWIFPISSWKNAGSWNWYAGVGGGAGYIWGWGRRHYEIYNYYGDWGYGYYGGNYGFIGAAGMIGVEYNFEFPLQLSVDFRPIIGPSFYRGGHVDFNYFGLFASSITVGVRYNFGK